MNPMPVHWLPPDVRHDLILEALRPGAAEPVAIHVRSDLHALIRPRLGEPVSGADAPGWLAEGSTTVRLVVDDGIPATPGFEVHRALPVPGLRRLPIPAGAPRTSGAVPLPRAA